jgi:hypothetical protein
MPVGTHLKRTFKSPFPALNVRRREEPVATDTVYSDTPAIDNGATQAQFFVGVHTGVCDVFALRNERQFKKVLADIIRIRGAYQAD